MLFRSLNLCSVSGYQGFCESDSTLFPASFWLSCFLVCLGFSFTMRGPRLRREPEATRTHVSPRRDTGLLGCHRSHKQSPQTPGPTAVTASPERFLFLHRAPVSRRGACLFPPRGAKRGLSWGGVSSWVPSGRVGSAPGAARSRVPRGAKGGGRAPLPRSFFCSRWSFPLCQAGACSKHGIKYLLCFQCYREGFSGYLIYGPSRTGFHESSFC